MRPWFEEYPDLLATEKVELGKLGYTLDDAEMAAGRVVFHGELTWEDEGHETAIVYPDSYPYLRPEVYAPSLRLGRHQNPHRGNLCLLDRSTRQWTPEDTGAWLVGTRIPLLLEKLVAGGDELRDAEAAQGEPASRFVEPEPGGVVFVPEEALRLPVGHPAGGLRIAVGSAESLGVGAPVRAAVVDVYELDASGSRQADLAAADPPLLRRFDNRVGNGRWVRIPDFWQIPGPGVQDVLTLARAQPAYLEPPWFDVSGGRMRILGVVGEEEVAQGVVEDGWLFVIETQRREGARTITRSYVVPGERLSLEDLAARVPSLRGMNDKACALTGLGTIGAPIALELAKSLTGKLRVLDHDAVETGNTVRWPVGLSAVGHGKATVIHSIIANDFPYTEIEGINLQLGSARPPGEDRGVSEREGIDALLTDADILVDATAELGIQHLLMVEARDRQIPQVYATMTEGGLGGMVARVIPGVTGCWLCLQWRIEDGDIPTPPFEETGNVQPRGCGWPTFTGTSVDALPVVAQAVQVVTQTLLGNVTAEGAHVFVLDQAEDPTSGLRLPKWTAHPLTPHERCEYCALS